MYSRLDINVLLDSFNNYLLKTDKKNKYNYFGRDPIIPSLYEEFETLEPPINQLLNVEELKLVTQYYNRNDLIRVSRDVNSMAYEEKLRLLETYINYLKLLGYNEYILYSEGFYDDIEDIKAFQLNVAQILEYL